MPVASTPYAAAACITRPPHPQPTSSSRWPALEAQLAADQVELGELGGVEIHPGSLEVGARVDHPIVEEEAVEVARHVVVVADGLAVALLRVEPPPQAGRTARGRPPPAAGRQAAQHRERRELRAPAGSPPRQLIGELEHALDAALDVEVVVQVRFGKGELAPAREHGAQRARVLEHQGGRARPLVRPDRPVPKPDSGRDFRFPPEELFEEPKRQAGLRLVDRRGSAHCTLPSPTPGVHLQ